MEVNDLKRTDLIIAESKLTNSEGSEFIVAESELNEQAETQMADNTRISHYVRVLEREEILCADVEELLGDYEEGDLPHSLKNRLDDHISLCSECAQLKAEYNLIIEVAEEMGKEEPQMPIEVQNRLRQRLNASLGLQLPILDMPLSELRAGVKECDNSDEG